MAASAAITNLKWGVATCCYPSAGTMALKLTGSATGTPVPGGLQKPLLVGQEPLVLARPILLHHDDLRLGKLSRIDSIPGVEGLSTIRGNMLRAQMIRPFPGIRRVDG